MPHPHVPVRALALSLLLGVTGAVGVPGGSSFAQPAQSAPVVASPLSVRPRRCRVPGRRLRDAAAGGHGRR